MIWFVDCEWGFRSDRLDQESAFEPVVFCFVSRDSGRHHFWGGDHRLAEFIHAHKGDLFVAHYAIAEMKYLLRRGIILPSNWFCTYVAYRRLYNEPGRIGASLLEALNALGLPHLAPAVKDELRDRILHLDFDPDNPVDRAEIINYCLYDCDGCGALYDQIADRIDPVAMKYWCRYLMAVARMELRGIPCDLYTARAILNSREA